MHKKATVTGYAEVGDHNRYEVTSPVGLVTVLADTSESYYEVDERDLWSLPGSYDEILAVQDEVDEAINRFRDALDSEYVKLDIHALELRAQANALILVRA